MNRIVWLLVFFCSALTVSGQTSKRESQPQVNQAHTKWIDETLRSIQMIKAGQTRSDLLKLFTTEGGLSWPAQRTYAYLQCPHIKVDVKFATTGRNEELPSDTIVDISRPYLAWSSMD
jgi:hypothetical protein